MTAVDEWLTIESLDLEGQGVAHDAEGKVIFIDGGLPGEQVQVDVRRSKKNWAQATLRVMRRESAQRVSPACPHFGICGGCKMQHLHVSAQLAVKQRAVEDALWHLGRVRPAQLLRPVEGPAWGYRYRARLSVRYVAKKDKVLIGFHERNSSYVAEMDSCAVLPPHVSALLPALSALVMQMDQRERLPQIELAVGDQVTALVLRHLEPLTTADTNRLRAFGQMHKLQWWLQPKGPQTAHLLDEGGLPLDYRLPDFGLTMPFKPTDFTQVNHAINRVLVTRAVQLLDVQPHERVMDWFCGLGNFTLPLATRASEVIGLEGSEELVARARQNAALNGLADRTRFEVRNLFDITCDDLVNGHAAQKWLIDPPREGAFALCKALVDAVARPASQHQAVMPQRIVYISCNPATLARDAQLLVHQAGYQCMAAGAVNMFPHTGHVESIAVLDKQ